MSAKLYIAGYDVIVENTNINTGSDHAYLFYDEDGNLTTDNDQKIIRGGPKGNYQGSKKVEEYENDPDIVSPNIILELRNDAQYSYDYRLEEETPADQDFRLLLSGAAAANAFNSMWAYALTLGEEIQNQHGLYDVGVDYDLGGPNSNSVINTMLSYIGIDFRLETPWEDNSTTIQHDPSDYPGHMGLLDGSGNDVLTAFYYNSATPGLETTMFHDNAGNDYLIVEQGAQVDLGKDSDAASWNNIVMTNWTLGEWLADDLYLQVVGDDLEVVQRQPDTTYKNIIDIEDQFTGDGNFNTRYLMVNINPGVHVNADTDEVLLSDQSAPADIEKKIDLRLLEEADFTGRVKLSRVFTALDDTDDVTGDTTDDYLYGNDAGNLLKGMGGADILRGGLGIDTFQGTARW